jgi:hypothetical protein
LLFAFALSCAQFVDDMEHRDEQSKARDLFARCDKNADGNLSSAELWFVSASLHSAHSVRIAQALTCTGKPLKILVLRCALCTVRCVRCVVIFLF